MNLNSISKYRPELMGIATIMILCCHASSTWTTMPYLLKRILGIGNLGVDLFLFLSGVGLSYSFEKVNSIKDICKWYKRRYIRILVPYTIIMLPLLFYYKISYNWSWSEYLLHFLTIDFWLHHKGAWFIAMILPLYAITPPLIWLFKRSGRYILTGIILSLLFYGLSLLKIDGSTRIISIIHNVQGCCLRVPAFFIGLSLYPSIKASKQINPVIVFCVSIIVLLFISYLGPQYEFPFITLIPILILLIFLLKLKMATVSLQRLFSFLGTMSLESYLTNVYLAEPCRKFFNLLPPPMCEMPTYIVYMFIVVIGLIVSYYVTCLSHNIENKFLL